MATPLLARALLAPECVMVLSILWRFVCGPSERFCPSSPTPCVPFIVHLLQPNLLTKRRVAVKSGLILSIGVLSFVVQAKSLNLPSPPWMSFETGRFHLFLC